MKNGKMTTIIGLVIGALLAAWTILQPVITKGGTIDWKMIIPAIIIAVVLYLEKDNGSWKTTMIGALLAAVSAGAAAYQSSPHNQWILVIVAILTSLGTFVSKDANVNDTTTIKTDS